MRHCVRIKAGWRDPMTVLGGWPDTPYTLGLISGGDGRWSWLARLPDRTETLESGDGRDPFEVLAALLGESGQGGEGPFSGGVAGLASYSLASRIEPLDLGASPDWPDLVLMRFPAVLAFDHGARAVWAIGRGESAPLAREAAERAASWLGDDQAIAFEGVLAPAVTADDPLAFEAAVEDVRARIADGEIFQANIARRWTGRLNPGAGPFDLFARLVAQSPAPYAAWLRLPGRAIVSNSPEQFVAVTLDGAGRRVSTRPIKGTAPRGATLALDEVEKQKLAASAKDRAENLMIVDLMRNDLARVCAPGSVETPQLFRLETFANVHHLVSTVTGRLRADASAADLLRATFPPGSITGAPKVQAMKVISELEPPRGPFFGAIFWAGFDGAFDSSVLIRTTAFVEDPQGWRFEARAGGGITADSVPHAERLETEDKISAILSALTEPLA